MAKIFDLATELLKTFLAPKEELLQTYGLSEKNLRAFLEHKGISDFLMYRYYQEEDDGKGIYHMADGRMGIIMRVFPTSLNAMSVEDSMFSLVDTLKTEGTVIHVNTFASRNINHMLRDFKDMHHCNVNVDNVGILKELVDETYDFLRDGANESIVDGVDLRVRDFVSTVSILFPLGTTKKKIISTYNQLQGNLRKLFPINFSGSSLVTLTKEMLNPEKPMKDWEISYDRHRIMNKQISSVGTSVKTVPGSGDVIVGDEWKYRTLTTKQFPNDKTIVSSYDFYNLFFDRFGENIQIPLPCPFFTSLVVVVGKVEDAREKASNKSRHDMKKVKKLKKDITDAHPELGERLKESKRTISLVEQDGQTPLDAMWSVTIMEKDESKLDEYTEVIKDRFNKQKNWHIEEEKFGNVALFVFLYSLPLQHHKLVENFVKRFDILFTSNCAAIAPLLGNISTNRMLIPYVDRNGQLIPYDNFNGDNYNESKTGASGAGKSYSQAYSHIMKLAAGVKQRVIDNGHSYKRFCNTIGGTYIDVGRDNNISMNFFTKANTEKISDEDGNDTEVEVLVLNNSGEEVPTLHREEIAGIVPIVGLMSGLDFITSGKEQSAEDSTDEAFLSSMITKAVRETFIIHQHNGKLEYTRQILLGYYKNEKEQENTKEASLLYKVYHGMYEFADPEGSDYIKFNTPNNLDLTKDYVVMDTLGLKGKILNICAVSLAFNIKSEFWKEGIKRRKSLDVDEGWIFKDNQLVIKIFEDNARTFRKSKSGQGFITQGIEDYSHNASMKALFGSSFHKLMLAQDNKEIEKVAKSEFFPLSSFEERMFTSVENKKPHWGEAMYMSKKIGCNAFIIKSSPKVHWLCAGADPDGNTVFDGIQEKYKLTTVETVRFLAKKSTNKNYSDNDLLHHAKNYSEQLNLDKDEEKRYWKEELNNALKEKRFRVKAEPLVDGISGKIIAFEVFLQLQHHDNSISSFPKFFEFAKEFNLEEKIFEMMLHKVFNYFENTNLKFHINLNTNEIRNHNFMNILIDLIGRYNIKDKLVLELKETDSNNNMEELQDFILKFHKLSVEIALDNVGLHYHKMAYIVMLDVDYIKVEGELLADAKIYDASRHVLDLITSLSLKSNEKSIIATKVENEEDIEFLKELKFGSYQGYINKNETIIIK